MSAALATTPPYTLRSFRGPRDTIAEMIRAIQGPRGERSVRVRTFTEGCVRGLQDKDYLSEILAVRYAVAERVRYLNDPLTTEWVKDPERLVEEIETVGRAAADCDEIAALIATMGRQLGREAELVTVGFVGPGDYSHVFARILEPKSKTWLICDPVAGTTEAQMLRRVRTYRIWRID